MIKHLLLSLLYFLGAVSFVVAQNRTITGSVTSEEDGASLPGVSIVITGTTQGTTTDSQGKYAITVPNEAQTLTFSFIGFKKNEIKIGSRNNIDVALATDASQLQEVVVTAALGLSRQKKELGYGTTTLKTTEVTQAKALNAASALSGKVSGLQINTVNNGVNQVLEWFCAATGPY